MTPIVVDASVTLSWCFPDEQSTQALEILRRLRAGDQTTVPAFWFVEVLNSLLIGERRGRISKADTEAFIARLGVLKPVVDHVALWQVSGPIQTICRDYHLTPYDALYVELALRKNCPLATLDRLQLAAAKALNIECL